MDIKMRTIRNFARGENNRKKLTTQLEQCKISFHF